MLPSHHRAWKMCKKGDVQGYHLRLSPQKGIPTLRTSPQLDWDHTTELSELSDRGQYLSLSICWPCSSGLSPSLIPPPPFGFDNGYSTTVIYAIASVGLAVHLVPYVADKHGIKSIPEPRFTKFTDAWLGWVAARDHKSNVVHELHRQYSPSISSTISKFVSVPSDQRSPLVL